MTDKQIIIDTIDVSKCEYITYKDSFNPMCGNTGICCYGRKNCCFKQLARKTQECEELREYHNKCCEEFENEKKELLEKYNQLSRDFYSGKYCNVEKCKQLDQLKADINKKELIFAGIEVSNRELIKELNQLKAAKEQAEQKLKRIKKLCDGKTNKSSFCNGIENKDMQKLAIRILQIVSEVK